MRNVSYGNGYFPAIIVRIVPKLSKLRRLFNIRLAIKISPSITQAIETFTLLDNIIKLP